VEESKMVGRKKIGLIDTRARNSHLPEEKRSREVRQIGEEAGN